MDQLVQEMWALIDATWSEMLDALRAGLPINEHKMFNDRGELVESNRPMLESIICDKIERSKRLFYYLCLAGIVSVPEANFEIKTRPDGGRDIIVGGFSVMPLGTGGEHVVE